MSSSTPSNRCSNLSGWTCFSEKMSQYLWMIYRPHWTVSLGHKTGAGDCYYCQSYILTGPNWMFWLWSFWWKDKDRKHSLVYRFASFLALNGEKPPKKGHAQEANIRVGENKSTLAFSQLSIRGRLLRLDCIEVSEKMTLLLSWCIPSVNIVNMSSWSQSLVSSLLQYSVMFV